jgi:hypothetical protein
VRFLGDAVLPAKSVGASQIEDDAGIEYTKSQQKFVLTYAQDGTIASATVPIHIVHGAAGGVIAVKAGSITACAGAATVTVDLKKNGTSVLAAVITLDSGNTARVPEDGTLVADPSDAADDFFELVVVATAGGGTLGTGLCVSVAFYEDPS